MQIPKLKSKPAIESVSSDISNPKQFSVPSNLSNP